MMAIKINKRRLLALVDAFMIFINLSTSYSIVPYILLTPNRYINAIIITLLTITYTIFRFIPSLFIRGHWAFKIYVCLHLLCCVVAYFTNTGVSSAIVYLLSNVSFFYLLYYVYKYNYKIGGNQAAIMSVIKPYLVIVSITLLGCAAMFVLLKMGFNPMKNDVSFKYDLFSDNATKFLANYYYPFYISIVEPNSIDIRIPFFQDTGFITGIYHEPHCMTFMTFPALFLMLFLFRGKKRFQWIVVVLYVLQLCLAGSTTNIAAFLCCVIVFLLYTFKSSLSKSIGLLLFLLLCVIVVASTVDLTLFDFIFKKIESGSMTYSMSTIDFALKPRTIFGTSFFNLGYLNVGSEAARMDVGYIPFIMNILFLITCIYYMAKLFKSKSKFKLAVLLTCVYFFAHSAKVAMVAYSLTMLIYMVFLAFIATQLSDKEEIIEVK